MAIAAGTGHSVAAITPARRVAARLLRDQRVRDGRSRELLRSSDALSALDERDRALATRLVLGVVASRQVQAKMGPDVLLSDTNYRLSKALYLLN